MNLYFFTLCCTFVIGKLEAKLRNESGFYAKWRKWAQKLPPGIILEGIKASKNTLNSMELGGTLFYKIPRILGGKWSKY